MSPTERDRWLAGLSPGDKVMYHLLVQRGVLKDA